MTSIYSVVFVGEYAGNNIQDISQLRICFGKGDNMAIWQVPITLVSGENIAAFDETPFSNSLRELTEILPEEKSWCSFIRQYGKLDSTCMEIDTEDDEILLRIDLRSITREQLEIIVGFAASNGLKIKQENNMQEPTVSNFVNIFRESAAYRFMSDPEAYLNTI